jgi:diguanylate cyclase (GGDEF)-like protein/PAS domain S-box-containing protein
VPPEDTPDRAPTRTAARPAALSVARIAARANEGQPVALSTHPAAQARRFASVVEGTTDLVLMVTADGAPLYANAAAQEILDLRPVEGRWPEVDVTEALPAWSRRVLEEEIVPALRVSTSWSGELAVRTPAGEEIPISAVVVAHRDRDGAVEYVTAICRDISERKGFEQRLAHQATHDALTGLPNRVLLLDRLAVAMSRRPRHHQPLAVLFCDLDQFKVVNDSLGHDIGDRLLTTVAARLAAVVRPGDTVARFGGDEFVILCDDLGNEDVALSIAERVARVLTEPIDVGARELVVSTSIGIAFHRPDHHRPEDLIRDADAAMYRAKERGRNRYEVFNDRLRERALIRLETERALRQALEHKELSIFYQPKIDLTDGSIQGVEALLRWRHPDRGLLLPGEFIALAEETGMIVPIGTWVLLESCRQMQKWQVRYPSVEAWDLSVNLSARQLADDVVDAVVGVLDATGFDPARLVLEMTESVLMADAAETVLLLRSLKTLGVRLAVDDFGTGYSSLAYLRRFPVDVVKIDRAFVAGLGENLDDIEIVRLVTTLAKTLRLEAVAEGVESQAQVEQLLALGCTKAQGFHLAAPMAPGAIESMLAVRSVDRSAM